MIIYGFEYLQETDPYSHYTWELSKYEPLFLDKAKAEEHLDTVNGPTIAYHIKTWEAREDARELEHRKMTVLWQANIAPNPGTFTRQPAPECPESNLYRILELEVVE